jgi:N12 class adenine-specific DNA methylase
MQMVDGEPVAMKVRKGRSADGIPKSMSASSAS